MPSSFANSPAASISALRRDVKERVRMNAPTTRKFIAEKKLNESHALHLKWQWDEERKWRPLISPMFWLVRFYGVKSSQRLLKTIPRWHLNTSISTTPPCSSLKTPLNLTLCFAPICSETFSPMNAQWSPVPWDFYPLPRWLLVLSVFTNPQEVQLLTLPVKA